MMTELMIRDATGGYLPATPEVVLAAARKLRESSWQPSWQFTDPWKVRDFLDMRLAEREREVFCVLFLDIRNHLLAFDEMFQGTLDATAVYPREVVKAALAHNAGAVIFAHNHPSGDVTPSEADRRITRTLVEALGLIDCRVLDHFIVGGQPTYSFAEHGLL